MHHGCRSLHRLSSVRLRSRTPASIRTLATNAQNIAVLGGGITGLAAAYYITQRLPRAKVTLFEASDRIGGWLLSSRVPVSGGSVLFEAGPRSLRTANNGILAAKLIDDLDLVDDTIFTPTSSPAANHRYLYYPDHLVRMPHPSFGFLNIAQTLISEPIFKGLLSGLFNDITSFSRDASLKDQSVGDFFAARFNRAIVDNLLSGVLHGIYAGDVYQLSARSLFARAWRDADQQSSVILGGARSVYEGIEMSFHDIEFLQERRTWKNKELPPQFAKTSVFTFKDGIGMLVDRLARNLWDSGNVSIQTGTKVSSMQLATSGAGIDLSVDGVEGTQTFDKVVSALSPAHLNALIASTEDQVPEIPSVTVMTVNLFFKNVEHLPPGPTPDRLGFGYLIPRSTPFEQNPERALGVVFDHAYALPKVGTSNDDNRITQDTLEQDGTKVTVMLGGHWWNDWPAFPDEQEGLKMARAVLERHLGISQAPEAYQVNLQRDCIPQYTVGHEDRLITARNNLLRGYKGNLLVAGNWISGVGVNDCLRSAWGVAHQLEQSSGGTGLEHIGDTLFARVQLRPRETKTKPL